MVTDSSRRQIGGRKACLCGGDCAGCYRTVSGEFYTGEWQAGMTAESSGLTDLPAALVQEPQNIALMLGGLGLALLNASLLRRPT